MKATYRHAAIAGGVLAVATVTFFALQWATRAATAQPIAPPATPRRRIRTHAEFHLRPVATGVSIGTVYPQGTIVSPEAAVNGVTRGTSTLFRAQVERDGKTGYLFLDPSELADVVTG